MDKNGIATQNLFGLTPVFKACNAVGSVGLFVGFVVEGVVAGAGVVGLGVVGLKVAAPAMWLRFNSTIWMVAINNSLHVGSYTCLIYFSYVYIYIYVYCMSNIDRYKYKGISVCLTIFQECGWVYWPQNVWNFRNNATYSSCFRHMIEYVFH